MSDYIFAELIIHFKNIGTICKKLCEMDSKASPIPNAAFPFYNLHNTDQLLPRLRKLRNSIEDTTVLSLHLCFFHIFNYTHNIYDNEDDV